jgi:hypothetical protein
MHAGLSAELQELAQHEAGFQLSLFQFAIPDDVLALHPLVGISPDAVYAAAMAQPFQGRLLSEWADNLEADGWRAYQYRAAGVPAGRYNGTDSTQGSRSR